MTISGNSATLRFWNLHNFDTHSPRLQALLKSFLDDLEWARSNPLSRGVVTMGDFNLMDLSRPILDVKFSDLPILPGTRDHQSIWDEVLAQFTDIVVPMFSHF